METLTQSAPSQAPAHHPNPEHILKIGMGFWASKTVLTAVNLKLFTLLARKPLTGEAVRKTLGLHPRAYLDFLDALVALGFLKREGIGAEGVYANAPDSDFFLDKNKPAYLGGILEMANSRLYRFWGDLETGLKTGLPQNEMKDASLGGNQFYAIYANPEALQEFLQAMSGIQMGAFMALAGKFDFSGYATFCDVGGANGSLSIAIARNNPSLHCTSFDLPAVEPIAKANIAKHNLSSRVKTASGDFFKQPLPKSDVIAMGNILHDWNDEEKLALMRKAYEALPEGGAFICVENIIDNDRSVNAFGLLMSLNMLIETKSGADFTFNDFDRLAHAAGFARTEWMPLAGPTSAAIAFR
jgi:precorrin-6B methylase 2